jgi:hypothetical protein
MRGVRPSEPRRAHVISTVIVEKCDASTRRGVTTMHVDTTVADTKSGADVSWACDGTDIPTTIAAATIAIRIDMTSVPRLSARDRGHRADKLFARERFRQQVGSFVS